MIMGNGYCSPLCTIRLYLILRFSYSLSLFLIVYYKFFLMICHIDYTDGKAFAMSSWQYFLLTTKASSGLLRLNLVWLSCKDSNAAPGDCGSDTRGGGAGGDDGDGGASGGDGI